MSHEVFISYATEDKNIANAVVAKLEEQGIRCWIAPRDIPPGGDWSESLLTAIEGCKVLVLVFSKHSNQSEHIKREVERAVHHGIPILPFRIEDALRPRRWNTSFPPRTGWMRSARRSRITSRTCPTRSAT